MAELIGSPGAICGCLLADLLEADDQPRRTAPIALAAVFVLAPGLPLLQVIVATQTLNGLLLPVVLIFVVRLANDHLIMRGHTNGRVFNPLAYETTAVLVLLTAALLLTSALGIGG